ncbi:MAG: RluA family pseudouridine synthase [Clostridium sp.]|nr:RluA family pseudouridine synthase [Clostridium sp.]
MEENGGKRLKQSYLVPEEFQGERIDKYLSEACCGLTRSYLQKLLKSQLIEVDGITVKSSYRVSAGETVALEVPEAVEPEIEAEPIPLDILYEDKDIILINKPKGMVVHPAAGHYSQTLVNGLMYHCRGDLSGINGVMRPGIVHRIDMDTTGVLIVCKNDFAHNSIAEQLKVHSITRKYYAIVHGVIREDEGTVDAPIGRHPVDRKKMSINQKNGKHAVTHYKVLERFKQFTYVECQLETGRTHQIRVHMASLNHPLLGDSVYGPSKCPFKLQGQTLHAGILGIIHPRTGEYMEFSAPLPEYFENLLEKLRKI